MSDTPKSAPSSGFSLFGNTASGGNANPPTSNLFGQNATGASTTSNNLFGGGGTQKPLFGGATTSGGFGAAASPSLTGGGFGSGATSGSAGFGFGKKPEDNKPATSSPFPSFATPSKTNPAEGTAPPSSNLFGNLGGATAPTSGSATPTTTQPKFSFGNISTTPAGPPPSQGGNVFNLGQASKSGTGLFGAPSNSQTNPPQSATPIGAQQPATATSQTSSTTLFGNTTSTAPAKTGSNLFGGSSSTQQTSNLFGKPLSETKPADGSSTPSEAPKVNLFGLPASNTGGSTTPDTSRDAEQSAAKRPALSFGTTTTTNGQSSGQPTPTISAPSLFGNAPAASAPPSTGLFGNLGAKKDAPASSTSQAPSLFSDMGPKKDTPAAAASGSSLFSGLAQKKDTPATSASPSTGLFGNLGAKKDTTETTAKPQDAAASGLAPATAPPAAGLFGSLGKPVESSSASNQTSGGTPANAGASLGASTAGPAPSNQSRLKNKSMDEIITRWASDLNKYQKEFQAQAEKVASWDRLLLENGNAISKLYSKTFQAERDTAEVQKQLSAVEGHQDELSQWLDRYEKEVDEMMARQVGQGEGLQGPDQERERTYKTAERVSDRLNDMSKELTSMIDEINEASAAISKTSKADDPLSQIVRVLNGHLSQLQLIDQGTVALQAKVTAAQKESQKLGSRGHGHSLGFDRAADDFYKSYMGRG